MAFGARDGHGKGTVQGGPTAACRRLARSARPSEPRVAVRHRGAALPTKARHLGARRRVQWIRQLIAAEGLRPDTNGPVGALCLPKAGASRPGMSRLADAAASEALLYQLVGAGGKNRDLTVAPEAMPPSKARARRVFIGWAGWSRLSSSKPIDRPTLTGETVRPPALWPTPWGLGRRRPAQRWARSRSISSMMAFMRRITASYGAGESMSRPARFRAATGAWLPPARRTFR